MNSQGLTVVHQTTLDAYHALDASTIKARILLIIRGYGSIGCNYDQIKSHFAGEGLKDGTINTRFSELEREGLIFRRGDVLSGDSGHAQLVLRHSDFKNEQERQTPGLTASPRRRTGFLAGLEYASKLLQDSSDVAAARATLGNEIQKLVPQGV